MKGRSQGVKTCTKILYFHHVVGKKTFAFHGCGLKTIDIKPWTEEKKTWIRVVADLFDQMLGHDLVSNHIMENMALRQFT